MGSSGSRMGAALEVVFDLDVVVFVGGDAGDEFPGLGGGESGVEEFVAVGGETLGGGQLGHDDLLRGCDLPGNHDDLDVGAFAGVAELDVVVDAGGGVEHDAGTAGGLAVGDGDAADAHRLGVAGLGVLVDVEGEGSADRLVVDVDVDDRGPVGGHVGQGDAGDAGGRGVVVYRVAGCAGVSDVLARGQCVLLGARRAVRGPGRVR